MKCVVDPLFIGVVDPPDESVGVCCVCRGGRPLARGGRQRGTLAHVGGVDASFFSHPSDKFNHFAGDKPQQTQPQPTPTNATQTNATNATNPNKRNKRNPNKPNPNKPQQTQPQQTPPPQPTSDEMSFSSRKMKRCARMVAVVGVCCGCWGCVC